MLHARKRSKDTAEATSGAHRKPNVRTVGVEVGGFERQHRAWFSLMYVCAVFCMPEER